MKAMVLDDIKVIEPDSTPLKLTDFELKDPGPDEILIKNSICGVCHTEIDQIEGRVEPTILPVIPGHQIVGRVHERGSDVKRFEIGDRVGVAWIYSSCGDCKYCMNGMENLCEHFKSTGRDSHGGYAEFTIVPAGYAFKINDKIKDSDAAPLLCAGSIGYRSLELTNIFNGESIGLMGFGASAQIVIKIIRYKYPDSKIYVFTRNEYERELSIKMGSVWAGDVDEKSPQRLEAIIDTTPAWKPVVESLDNLNPSGRLVINAIRKEDYDIDYLRNIEYKQHLWMEKEIKSVANISRQDVENFLNLAVSAGIKPKVHSYDLEDANNALLDLKFGRITGAKILKIN